MPSNQQIVILLQVRYNRYQYNLTLVNQLYQAKIAKVVSQRVLDTSTNGGCPQVEPSTIQNGIIKSVGNVTNFATWTNTLKSDKIIWVWERELLLLKMVK